MTEIPIKFKSAAPEIADSKCDGSELYALQVLGVDMEDEFPDKCIVVIQQFEIKVPDSYVVAEIEGSTWFRQYKIDSAGREYLHACNEIYPDIELNSLKWNVDWKIKGIIRQRNMRRKIKTYKYPNEWFKFYSLGGSLMLETLFQHHA